MRQISLKNLGVPETCEAKTALDLPCNRSQWKQGMCKRHWKKFHGHNIFLDKISGGKRCSLCKFLVINEELEVCLKKTSKRLRKSNHLPTVNQIMRGRKIK